MSSPHFTTIFFGCNLRMTDYYIVFVEDGGGVRVIVCYSEFASPKNVVNIETRKKANQQIPDSEYTPKLRRSTLFVALIDHLSYKLRRSALLILPFVVPFVVWIFRNRTLLWSLGLLVVHVFTNRMLLRS